MDDRGNTKFAAIVKISGPYYGDILRNPQTSLQYRMDRANRHGDLEGDLPLREPGELDFDSCNCLLTG
jgi:hypothetical protein